MTNNRPGRAWRLMLAASCLGLVIQGVRADQANQLEVGVRPSVLAKPANPPAQADLPAVPEHGRVYAILSVQLLSSIDGIMEPIDELRLLNHLCHALDSHGFRPAMPGQSPDILLTVHYGRAWLRNPYLTDASDAQALVGISSVTGLERMANQSITGSTTQLMDEMSPTSTEVKIRKAGMEKLYIRVAAWQYPTDLKARAKILWKTIMVVDDPEHRDLNILASRMLEAGAPYFDRETVEKEVAVYKPLPEGQVKVGNPQVIEPEKPDARPKVRVPAMAVAGADGPIKKFDLRAGDAVATLQAFSKQSGEEIIYPVEQVRGIRTNVVSGELSARSALDRMLDGTGLMAVQDEKTGAFAVRQAPPPPKLPPVAQLNSPPVANPASTTYH